MSELLYHAESETHFVDDFTEHRAEQGCTPARAYQLPAGTVIDVGTGRSVALPDFDFETYSEAGYTFDEKSQKWRSITKSPPHGLGAVGAAAYSEHPSTEVLSLSYNLKDGLGERLWLPGMPPPSDLFDHIARGGLLEAWNSGFEYQIWRNVCAARMGWPPLPFEQLRDAMAKSRAFSLPGKLGDAAKVLKVEDQKLDGLKLINKFSKPRNPTKNDPRKRIRPTDPDQVDGDGQKFYDYNIGDTRAESAASAMIPDLSPAELQLWLVDQAINFRGVYIDPAGLSNCKAIIEQASERYTAELVALTGGTVESAGEIQKLSGWLGAQGVHMASLDAENVEQALKRDDLPDNARRVLEIRASLGAASVKKLFAIDRRLSRDGRLRDLFAFCGADRTGRFAGRGPQPQNLPNSGPPVRRCDPVNGCGRHYGASLDVCPWCSAPGFASESAEWNALAVEDALAVIAYRELRYVEAVFGDATAVVSGCLRGLFSAPPGREIICSDYSAIEAVVLAALSGEEWRLEVFRTHGKIYEMSAAKISGIPFGEFMAHAGYTDLSAPRWWEEKQTGDHHPLRKKIGKISELSSGYQGGYGAWCAFGADKHLSEAEIRDAIKAWRAASPMIVNFWHDLEAAAIAAVTYPGNCYSVRGLSFGVKDDVLYCQLLSGRKLCYHRPRLFDDVTPWGKPVKKLTYEGFNSDYKKGPRGWLRMDTYGGKLCENVVQATARDILTHALVNLERAGYEIVLHVHDEPAAEVPEGWGSVEGFERIMVDLPDWAAGWPIRAAGGWRGKRYRKD